MSEKFLKHVANIKGFRVEQGIADFNEFSRRAIPRTISKSVFYKKITMFDYFRTLLIIVLSCYLFYELSEGSVKLDVRMTIYFFIAFFVFLMNFYIYWHNFRWNKVLKYGKLKEGTVKNITYRPREKSYIIQVVYRFQNGMSRKYLFDIPEYFEEEFMLYINGHDEKIDLLIYKKIVELPLLRILENCYKAKKKKKC